MNGLQLAKSLGTSTRMVGDLLKSGRIKAKRVKQVWECDLDSVNEFCRKNKAAVTKLKRVYMDLYWQGVSIEALEKRTRDDFKKRKIVWPADGFAVGVIYENHMRKPKNTRAG